MLPCASAVAAPAVAAQVRSPAAASEAAVLAAMLAERATGWQPAPVLTPAPPHSLRLPAGMRALPLLQEPQLLLLAQAPLWLQPGQQAPAAAAAEMALQGGTPALAAAVLRLPRLCRP